MPQIEISEPGAERRRFNRVDLPLRGRLMLSDREEYDCVVRNLSIGSIRLKTDADGRLGERVIIYIDHIGRLEGRVSRKIHDGFALDLDVPMIKREKMLVQMRWLADLYGRRRLAG